MSSTIASPTASSSSTDAAHSAIKAPANLKVVGIILAVVSGLLIGSSFVLKKKGLLRSQAGGPAGEGVGYLKSVLWWTGMILMILGEICNFAAYAFVDAVVVTPLGALSVVICAILSSIFLQETLTFFGWVGCGLCILGSVIIALNGPKEQTVSGILEFQKLFLSVGFLVFGSLVIISALVILFYFVPRYGKKQMIWYIAICSLIGGLSVSCTQGLGTAIVVSAQGNNQFKHWFTYFLLIFVTVTLLVEIYYLNVALALFNTAMVTPTYYVVFTTCTLVTSMVLYQGLKASVTDIITLVMGFFVICAGVVILQMSKVDPESLGKLDRKSTLLLKASKSTTQMSEKSPIGYEDPGMDALRSFGTVGSIMRARSAKRTNSSGSAVRSRHGVHDPAKTHSSTHGLDHLPRHQLYDPPVHTASDVPYSPPPKSAASLPPTASGISAAKSQTIKFGEDVAHYYPGPGATGEARHEPPPPRRNATPALPEGAMPPRHQPTYGSFHSTASSSSSSASSTPAPVQQPTLTQPYEDPFGGRNFTPNPFATNSIDSFPDSSIRRESPEDHRSSLRYSTHDSGIGSLDYTTTTSYDDDREERQRLVDRSSGDSPTYNLRSGGIRLLPTAPRSDSQV